MLGVAQHRRRSNMDNHNMPESLRTKRIERAVEISAEMFLKNGIESVKMTDIADACGVGVATLYRYFGTKTAITIAAMAHLWTRLRGTYENVFESENFLKQPGIKRLSDLMLQRENVPKAALFEYERSIVNFYPYIEAAYLAGTADGTVRRDIDFKLFYLTYGHSMLQLCKKMLGGELLPSDDFSAGRAELKMLANIAVSYLRVENTGT